MSLAEMDPGVHDACSILKELSADDAARLEAQMREKAWRDEMDRLDGAIAKGRKEGLEEGMFKAKREDALSMLQEGLSIEMIERITKLPIAEIKKLNAQIVQ